MTNEIKEEKINRKKKTQSVTTNEIREEKITKKNNPITQLNPTRSNSTQRCLGSWISKFTLDCDFANPIYIGWVQKIY